MAWDRPPRSFNSVSLPIGRIVGRSVCARCGRSIYSLCDLPRDPRGRVRAKLLLCPWKWNVNGRKLIRDWCGRLLDTIMLCTLLVKLIGLSWKIIYLVVVVLIIYNSFLHGIVLNEYYIERKLIDYLIDLIDYLWCLNSCWKIYVIYYYIFVHMEQDEIHPRSFPCSFVKLEMFSNN